MAAGDPEPEEMYVARRDVEAARDGAARGKRMQKTWYLTREVIERANGAVYWALPSALAAASRGGDEEIDTSQIPDSASSLVESALWAEILRLERLFHGGQPFPRAPGRLRTGPGQGGVSRLSEPRPRRTSDIGEGDPDGEGEDPG